MNKWLIEIGDRRTDYKANATIIMVHFTHKYITSQIGWGHFTCGLNEDKHYRKWMDVFFETATLACSQMDSFAFLLSPFPSPLNSPPYIFNSSKSGPSIYHSAQVYTEVADCPKPSSGEKKPNNIDLA